MRSSKVNLGDKAKNYCALLSFHTSTLANAREGCFDSRSSINPGTGALNSVKQPCKTTDARPHATLRARGLRAALWALPYRCHRTRDYYSGRGYSNDNALHSFVYISSQTPD